MKLIRNKESFGRTLQRFYLAYGFFLIFITFYKLIIERILFFRSSFLAFYFGSIIIWFIYFFLAIFSGREEPAKKPEIDFPTKKKGKYKLIFEFEKEEHAKKFHTTMNSLITHQVFGRIPIGWWIDVEDMGNNKKNRKRNIQSRKSNH
jgi:amino acid permease